MLKVVFICGLVLGWLFGSVFPVLVEQNPYLSVVRARWDLHVRHRFANQDLGGMWDALVANGQAFLTGGATDLVLPDPGRGPGSALLALGGWAVFRQRQRR